VRALRAAEDRRKEIEASRRELIRSYAETTGCRWRFVLTYFGRMMPTRAATATRCESGAVDDDLSTGGERFPAGARVAPREWGSRRVVRAVGDTVTVLLDDSGYRNLSVAAVIERGLLRVAGG